MNRLRMYLVASALAVSALGIVISGCTKEGERKVTAPAAPPGPDLSEIRDARWITSPDELRGVTAGAAKSPLMQRAIQDEASDPRLGLLKSGVIAAVGTTKNGDQVRVTLLPYQYSDDLDHARYFVLYEVNGRARAETFDLIRNRRPAPGEEGFQRVNSGEHGLWMRAGSTYAQASSGDVHKAPEKFNWARFGTCFVPLADRLLGEVDGACHAMGDFPGCRTIGSGAALAGAATYCAWVAWGS